MHRYWLCEWNTTFFPLHTSNILGFIFTIWISQWKTGAHLAKFRIMTMVYVLYVHSKWMPVWKCQENLQNCTKRVTMEIFCLCQLNALLSLAVLCVLSVSWPLSWLAMNLMLTATWEDQCFKILLFRGLKSFLLKSYQPWHFTVELKCDCCQKRCSTLALKLKGQWQDRTLICPTCLTSCLAGERTHTEVWQKDRQRAGKGSGNRQSRTDSWHSWTGFYMANYVPHVLFYYALLSCCFY